VVKEKIRREVHFMQNIYYHDFTVGFNWWYVLAPLMLLSMFFIGYLNVKRFQGYTKDRGRMKKAWVIDRRRFTDYVYIFFGALSTLAFAMLFIDESMLGCIQVLDNIGISNEDGAWSPIIAFVFVLPSLCCLYAALTYGAASLGEHVHAALLASTIEDFLGKDARRIAHKHYFNKIEEQHNRREAFCAMIEEKLGIVTDKIDLVFTKFEKAIY
jgi:hypothetical protein